MYDFFKDFAGPLATMLQNVILAVGAYFAWSTIRNNHDISKKRATLDMIHNLAHDEKYNSCLKQVNTMRIEERDAGSLYTDMKNKSLPPAEREAAIERYRAAQSVLNKWAIFANGIRNHALDEQSFKEYYYSTYVENVEYLRAFILSIRKIANKQIHSKKFVSPDTVYSEVEWLLDKWKASPLGAPENK